MNTPGIKPRLLLVGGPDVDKRLDLMDRLSNEFEAIAVGSLAELEPVFAQRGYAYVHYRLDRGFNPRSDQKTLWQLRGLFKRLKPTIVHSFDTKPNVIARPAAWRAGVPVIIGTQPGLGALYTYHTPQVLERRALFRKRHRFGCEVSTRTVFQNEDDRQLFIDEAILPANKAVLIRGSGIPAAAFSGGTGPEAKRHLRKLLGLPTQGKIILSAARLIKAKGIMDVVAAAAQLKATHPQYHFVVAGGQDPGALDALSPAELENMQAHVLWLGESQQMNKLMAASDAFVFPSYYREGVPRVLVEAAYAQLPLVTTNEPGCREVVQHSKHGLLVPKQNPTALAQATLQLFNHPQRTAQMVQNARLRALDLFELGKISQQYRRLYRELIEERKTKASRS